jgi:hypothetical protein
MASSIPTCSYVNHRPSPIGTTNFDCYAGTRQGERDFRPYGAHIRGLSVGARIRGLPVGARIRGLTRRAHPRSLSRRTHPGSPSRCAHPRSHSARASAVSLGARIRGLSLGARIRGLPVGARTRGPDNFPQTTPPGILLREKWVRRITRRGQTLGEIRHVPYSFAPDPTSICGTLAVVISIGASRSLNISNLCLNGEKCSVAVESRSQCRVGGPLIYVTLNGTLIMAELRYLLN